MKDNRHKKKTYRRRFRSFSDSRFTPAICFSSFCAYQYTPPRPLEVIEREIRELEGEIMKALAAVGR